MKKFKPYNHQLVELKRAEDSSRGLFWEMGVGKTLGTILILRQHYIKAGKLRKTLILGPTGVLYNWKDEIMDFSKITGENIFVSLGNGVKRVNDLFNFLVNKEINYPDRSAIVVINYEGLRNAGIFKILKDWAPEILVCDESHLVKSPKAQISERTFELSLLTQYRYILTGTPLLNNELDFYHQMRILDHGRTFGNNYYIFRNKWFSDKNAGWKAARPDIKVFSDFKFIEERREEFSKLIYQTCSRVLLKDVVDLPPRIEKTIYVELSAQQKKAYEEMKRDFITFVSSELNSGKPSAIVAQIAMVKAIRLQQICCGIFKTDEGEEIILDNVPRLEELENIIREVTVNNKVIVWCGFTANYRQVMSLCDKIGVKYVLITGSQNALEKQAAVMSLQDDDQVKVCIANRKAGGTGINLTKARYSVNYSKGFSLGEELQSRARNYRIGSQQHESIIAYDLIAKGTIDEEVTKALNKKHDLSKGILDLVKDL